MRNFKFILLSLVAATFIFAGCQKIDADDIIQTEITSSATPVNQGSFLSLNPDEICGDALCTNIELGDCVIGEMCVSNDEENLYVTIKVDDDHVMKYSYIYVGGQAPTKSIYSYGNVTCHPDGTKEYCYIFSLSKLMDCSFIGYKVKVESVKEKTCTKTCHYSCKKGKKDHDDRWRHGKKHSKCYSCKYKKKCRYECDEGCEYESGWAYAQGTDYYQTYTYRSRCRSYTKTKKVGEYIEYCNQECDDEEIPL